MRPARPPAPRHARLPGPRPAPAAGTGRSALLGAVVVPALLAVPVLGAAPADPARASQPRAVPSTVRTLPLQGVDEVALGALRADTARTVPDRTAAALDVPAVLTGPLPTGRFDLVALGWQPGPAGGGAAGRDGGDARVTGAWVRVREGGVWTGWTPLGTGADGADGPDPVGPDASAAASAGTGALRTTEPLLTAGADAVQVRVDTATGIPPQGLTLDLVDGGRSGTDAAVPVTGASVAGGTSQPAIIRRSAWGADESLVKAAPVVNGAVKALIVHHTDTSNSYSRDQAFAQVRSLYAFHTRVRGWNDLGYNFVVDRYGRVFEGRRGSITEPVMGAHAGGFNAETQGVAVLGTFSSASLPSGADRALPALLAWQAAAYGIDPRGRATLISAGGSYTRYRAGTPVSVHGVSGHRDVDSTECPGDAAYPRLASLRARAAALMVPALVAPDVTGAPTTVAGGPVTVSAVLATRQRWWLTVRPLCGGPPVRIVSGTATGRFTGTWDLRDSRGRPVPPGAYLVTVTSSSPVGWAAPVHRQVEVLATPQSLAASRPAPSSPVPPAGTPSGSAAPSASGGPGTALPAAASNGCPVQRVAGTDPALTSVAAGRLARPQARSVVLVNPATAQGLAQSVAAGPLAVARSAPVLVTGAAQLPAVVAQDVAARRATTAWLVGPVSVISAAVEAQLRDLGVTTVTRVTGTDRWSTAAAVSALVGAPRREAVLVPGDQGDLLDAFVAAGSAAAAGTPVLLTSAKGVPAATAAALKALRVTDVTVVGSTVAVPERTLQVLSAAGVTHRTRVVGPDRWRTAAAVAGSLGTSAPADRVVLTSGLDLGADLAVASGQGRRILLTTQGALPAATAGWLRAHRAPGISLIARPAAATTAVLTAAQSTRP